MFFHQCCTFPTDVTVGFYPQHGPSKREEQLDKDISDHFNLYLRICVWEPPEPQCWQRKKKNTASWKMTNLPCRRLDGADGFPGRPWDWDKYRRVIESLRLFPVRRDRQDRTYKSEHRQTLHHNFLKDMEVLFLHSSSKRKHICLSGASALASHCNQAELSLPSEGDEGTGTLLLPSSVT